MLKVRCSNGETKGANAGCARALSIANCCMDKVPSSNPVGMRNAETQQGAPMARMMSSGCSTDASLEDGDRERTCSGSE